MFPNLPTFFALASGPGLEPGPTVFGFTLWVDPGQTFFAIDSATADDLDFALLHLPLPSSSAYENLEFSAMAITLNPCSPDWFAGSQRVLRPQTRGCAALRAARRGRRHAAVSRGDYYSRSPMANPLATRGNAGVVDQGVRFELAAP